MKISLSRTYHAGPVADFPHVDNELSSCFPNAVPLFERINEISSRKLLQETRRLHHVLRQLTFSYLAKDYLIFVVEPALKTIPDRVPLSSLKTLRQKVQNLIIATQLTTTSVVELNKVALDFFADVTANHVTLVEEAMNNLGRLIFSAHNSKKQRQVFQYVQLLAFVTSSRIGETKLCELFREALSFNDFSDCGSLKDRTRVALVALRDNLVKSVKGRCFFFCPDIRIGSHFRLGPASFFPITDPNLLNLVASSPPDATEWIKRNAECRKSATIAVLEEESHPEDRGLMMTNAAMRLNELLGFIVSQGHNRFCPPRNYDGMATACGDDRVYYLEAAATPRNSALDLYNGGCSRLEQNYARFVAPAFTSPVERILQEKLRRVLVALRKASFFAGCGEYSQAFSAAWQAYEVVFGGIESRERGDTIAKRVAALAVDPNGRSSDDEFPISDADLLRFAEEYAAGRILFQPAGTLHELLIAAATSQPWIPRNLQLLKVALGPEAIGRLLTWKDEQLRAASSETSGTATGDHIVARRDELKRRILEFYKLRNDIVHSSYDGEEIAQVMYEEMFKLFSSFVLNLAFNCTLWKTYDALLVTLDQQWQSGRRAPISQPNEDDIRLEAFYQWERRGKPLGDELTDWLNARKV